MRLCDTAFFGTVASRQTDGTCAGSVKSGDEPAARGTASIQSADHVPSDLTVLPRT